MATAEVPVPTTGTFRRRTPWQVMPNVPFVRVRVRRRAPLAAL